jgi:hypothetical protein
MAFVESGFPFAPSGLTVHRLLFFRATFVDPVVHFPLAPTRVIHSPLFLLRLSMHNDIGKSISPRIILSSNRSGLHAAAEKMYLKQTGFWEAEKTAPLMLLNKGSFI